jgi:hypothetical protein
MISYLYNQQNLEHFNLHDIQPLMLHVHAVLVHCCACRNSKIFCHCRSSLDFLPHYLPSLKQLYSAVLGDCLVHKVAGAGAVCLCHCGCSVRHLLHTPTHTSLSILPGSWSGNVLEGNGKNVHILILLLVA